MSFSSTWFMRAGGQFWWLLLLFALQACGARSSLLGEPPPGTDVPSNGDATFDVRSDDRSDGNFDGSDVRPDVRPDVPIDVPWRVDVACPATVMSTQSLTETLTAQARSNVGAPLTYRWTVMRRPTGSMSVPTPADQPSTRFTFDTGGEWIFTFTATDTAGNMGTCNVRALAAPAIDLLCPNDQSNFQGATVALNGTARSRLMRPITIRWTVESAPMGSTSQPMPADQVAGVRFLLDRLGDWRLRLTATDSTGLRNECVVNLHADPDVIVECPPNQVSRPFASVNLTAMARSRLGLPLRYNWEIVDFPITSTARLLNTDQLTSRFTFDVAGDWTYRFTATNANGNMAFCTTRALSASEEAVRVEIVWNTDRSCRGCNMRGGGLDIDLHLADVSRAMGRWAGSAPDGSDCYYANCKCDRQVGMLCPDGVLQWPPMGAANNPQLDIDNTGQPDLGPGPENINITQAQAGSQFDVGVHYFADNTGMGANTTPVIARVYCAGTLAFESEAVRLSPSAAGGNDSNPLWWVGRVTVTPGGCRFERCGRPGMLTECIRPQNQWNGTMGM